MSTARAAARGIVRKAVFQGDRELRSSCTRFANDFRALRIRAGLSQAATGRAVGVDRSVICRLEAGDESVSPAIRARAAALLGAEFRMALYPLGAPMILDAAQARAIETILQLRDPRWKAIVEAPVPGPGRRSSDLRLDHVPDVVLIEFESRVTHWEEILRKCHEKREAVVASLDPDRQVHVVLAMSPSRRHRALVREHPGMIRAAFPVPAADIDRALRNADRPFPGDGLLWVAGDT